MTQPILQFGTSRFLLAHVDLFISQALERGDAIGGITVVQTTGNAASRGRVAALNDAASYPVHIRGRDGGVAIETTVECRAVRAALSADSDWATLRRIAIEDVRIIVSNTGDRGYLLDERDTASLLTDQERAPHSFPAKLLVLLYARWCERPTDGVSLYPCELIADNGTTLRDIVLGLGRAWALPEAFLSFLRDRCAWVNSLVDRIVSEPIHPIGAVAEPYALWAIERCAAAELPCTHEHIALTDDLQSFERLKLFYLNLGHTWLADQWLSERRDASETVLQAMHDTRMRDGLEGVWQNEVLPVFAALGLHDRAQAYLESVRERLLNPYLQHRIGDIAQNHGDKIRRRIAPLIELADSLSIDVPQPALRRIIENRAHGPS